MPKGTTHWFALLMTLAVAGGGAYWAWNGLKSPPVHEPVVSIVTTPAGWIKFDAGPFTFYAPKYAVLHKLEEPGHVVGQIIGLGFYVRYEFGIKPDTLVDKANNTDFSESETLIDGRRAILRQATLSAEAQQARFGSYAQPSYIGLYIPQAIRATGPGGKAEWYALQIEGAAKNDDLRDMVETIFKSIRFHRVD